MSEEINPVLDGENDARYTVRVSFRIWGSGIDPDEITAALAMEPNGAYRRGERLRSPSGRLLSKVFEETYWYKRVADSTCPPHSLHEEIDRLVTELEPKAKFLHALREKGATMGLFIGWFIEGNSGDTIDYKLLGRLSELGIDIDFDIYTFERREQSSPQA